MENKSKLRLNIKLIAYFPLVLLISIFCLVSLLVYSGFGKVKTSVNIINDTNMIGISEVSKLEVEFKELNNLSLCHIVSTDINSMVKTNRDIESLENEIETQLNDLKNNEYFKSNYNEIQDIYTSIKLNIRLLMGYSAAGNNVDAYKLINDEINPLFKNVNGIIDNLVDEILNDTSLSVQDIISMVTSTNVILSILLISSIIVSILSIILFRQKLIKPLLSTTNSLIEMVNGLKNKKGNLNIRMTNLNNNEIGDMNKSINELLDVLQNILRTIITHSQELDGIVNEVENSTTNASNSVTDLSAVTEELAATMSEVESSTCKIRDNTQSVNNEVEDMVLKSKTLLEYTQSMKDNVTCMENDAKKTLDNIGTKVTELLDIVNKSIEDSNQVNQVASLTNDILEIASQTNLLSLNASIEAARAGESGKGFAVVAGEIGHLATNSKDIANNIQKINTVVLKAVQELADNSKKLVEFLNSDILPEFNKFVDNSSDYKEKTIRIEEIVNLFNEQSNSLGVSMNDITSSISSITTSVEEGAKGVSSTAESTQLLVEEMMQINNNMSNNSKISNDLKECTSIFVDY